MCTAQTPWRDGDSTDGLQVSPEVLGSSWIEGRDYRRVPERHGAPAIQDASHRDTRVVSG